MDIVKTCQGWETGQEETALLLQVVPMFFKVGGRMLVSCFLSSARKMQTPPSAAGPCLLE